MSSATKTEIDVSKICETAEDSIRRSNLKPNDRARTKEAFEFLIDAQKWIEAPSYCKKGNLQEYLRQLYAVGEAQLVMVCVIGVGLAAMCATKKSDRRKLLAEIVLHQRKWDAPILQSLAQQCWIEGNITAFLLEPAGLTETVQTTTDSQAPPAPIVATVPAAMLDGILGNFLVIGMDLSRTRRAEGQPYTRAVCLHLPFEPGGDFTFEVFLFSAVGKSILEVTKLREKDLEFLLGKFLFERMQTSKHRTSQVLTSAVSIVDDCSGDKRLRVKVNHDAGHEIWAEITAISA